MSKLLRALIVEDSEDDALLVVRQLRSGGYDVTWERVDTAEAMRTALGCQLWDVVIVDYTMPRFSGLAALELLKASGKGLPIIVVSGTIGEEKAVAAMKAGAHDYIMKGNLARLVPAVTRELRDAVEWRARQRAEAELRESEVRYRALFNESADGIVIADIETKRLKHANPALCRMLGYTEDELRTMSVLDIHPKDAVQSVVAAFEAQARGDKPLATDIPCLRKDGSVVYADINAGKITLDDRPCNVGFVRDITARKRAEAAVQESAEKYRDLVEHANSIILRWTRDGRITFLNEFGQKFFGYAEAEILGRNVLGTIVPASESTSRDLRLLMEQIGAHPEAFAQSTNENMRRNGERVWVAWTNKLERDKQGQANEILSIGSDITERKRAEDGVRMSASLLRATLESTADGILVVDAKGKVLDYNTQFGEMWRVPESILATHQDQKLLDCVREQLTAPDEFLAKVRELYAQPASESFDTLQFKDGRVFERFSHPQRIGDRIVGRVWSFRNVTRHVQAEARNREQAALLDNANDAIYVTALDCTILYWNQGAARTYGWTSAEALNRKTSELLASDPAAAEALAEVLLKQGSWSGERGQKTKSGRKVEVFSRLTLVRNAQGQPQSIFAINTDITEKKQLEAQFLRSQRLESIGALASGIAHDLNNVLTPILMGAPLLREAVQTDEARDMVAAIETSAKRAANIVKQVLTFARGVPGERVPLEPRHLIREMVKFAGETFPKNIRIEATVAEDLWPIQGDATQMHQALMNLCVNARDAMPTGGLLRLTAENIVLDEAFAKITPDAKPGPHVCLAVVDTGTGIPLEHLDKLFDPFFTTKAPGQGTGLGLSTVLGIARSHGGFVKVRTEVGEGTTFELYLPAALTTEVTIGPAVDSASPWAHGELILVVDDEDMILEITRRVLESVGYKVMTAAEGAEAIGIFGRHHRDIQAVITDMMMPGIDGPSLVGALRAIEPGVRIIGISGVGESTGVTNLQALALPAFLAKPFPIHKLLKALHHVLHSPDSPASA